MHLLKRRVLHRNLLKTPCLVLWSEVFYSSASLLARMSKLQIYPDVQIICEGDPQQLQCPQQSWKGVPCENILEKSITNFSLSHTVCVNSRKAQRFQATGIHRQDLATRGQRRRSGGGGQEEVLLPWALGLHAYSVACMQAAGEPAQEQTELQERKAERVCNNTGERWNDDTVGRCAAHWGGVQHQDCERGCFMLWCLLFQT